MQRCLGRPAAAVLLALSVLAAAVLPSRAGVLPITPVVQQTQVWCWVAVGEMIFRYLGIPNVNPAGVYQCGIIGALAADQYGMSHPCTFDCTQCVVPAGTEAWVRAMLERYPVVVQSIGLRAPSLASQHEPTALSADMLAAEIDGGYPVVAGISPFGSTGGVSAHVALIVGYERDAGGGLVLKVNDPYPFDMMGANPYVAAGGREDGFGAGSYWIGYDDFVTHLQWAESFRIRRGQGG
jgi:hypothetical protein